MKIFYIIILIVNYCVNKIIISVYNKGKNCSKQFCRQDYNNYRNK